tara:strand:- start:1480 stop:1707 length:228 start_codon:yes stop_codon:yes gene_type:complete
MTAPIPARIKETAKNTKEYPTLKDCILNIFKIKFVNEENCSGSFSMRTSTTGAIVNIDIELSNASATTKNPKRTN